MPLEKSLKHTTLEVPKNTKKKKYLTYTIHLGLLNNVAGLGIVGSWVARVKLWSGWRGCIKFWRGLRGSKYGLGSVGGLIPQNFGMG